MASFPGWKKGVCRMTISRIPLQEALEQVKTLPRALIIEMSRVYLGPAPSVMDSSEWVEAHFYGADREIRFMPGMDGLEAFSLTESETEIEWESYLDYTAGVMLERASDSAVHIRKYLARDNDGQNYICASRLVWKEGAK